MLADPSGKKYWEVGLAVLGGWQCLAVPGGSGAWPKKKRENKIKSVVTFILIESDSVCCIAQKMKFPLRISSVNVTKSWVSCGFGHIYWRNP